MNELDDANAAIAALTTAINILASDLRAGVIDPAMVESLAAQMKAQSDCIQEAIADAKAARGEE
jgi:hypothetical protein